MELVDNRRHDVQNFGFACIWHVTVVVDQNGLKEWWDHVGIDHFKIVRLLHVGINEFQNLLLNGAKSPDFRGFGGDAPWTMSALV